LLSENPEPEQVELVRYIPQGRFEALCNEHVSGKSNEFEEELRSVIFAHVPTSKRTGSSSFQELIERLEEQFRKDLAERRKELSSLNENIAGMEEQLNPVAVKYVDEQLKLLEQQRAEHLKARPAEEVEPTETLTPQQNTARDRILKIDEELNKNEKREADVLDLERRIAEKIQAIQSLTGRISRLKSSYNELISSSIDDAMVLKISLDNLLTINIDVTTLLKREDKYRSLIEIYFNERASIQIIKESLGAERTENAGELAAPQQKYQNYLVAAKKWQTALDAIDGVPSNPESVLGLKSRLSYLDELPKILEIKKLERSEITMKIFCSLEDQRSVRESLFEPLQKVIQNNELIREDYQLNFQAKFDAGIDRFSSQLFDLVKQSSGELRGEDKSYEAVRNIFEVNDLKTKENAAALVNDLYGLVDEAARNLSAKSFGVTPILRKDRSSASVYDHIFGLRFVEPKYTLLFQDTQIEQLSPGQRGSLLLIFYLLVDDGRNPIVLDQPEENLDNQTIVSLLVPVLNEAKKNRQIFMVTHNPNLAVVCDAEQIVYAEFDRKAGPEIKYYSGAIEEKGINKSVVDVLEGTISAFNNRKIKYH